MGVDPYCDKCNRIIPQAQAVAANGTINACPFCGHLGQSVPYAVRDTLALKESLGGSSVVSGNTGREVALEDGTYTRAKEWYASSDLARHRTATAFRDLIRNAQIVSGGTLTLFRGRHIASSKVASTESADLGPPPVSGENRYNRTGESVLYLADSSDGVYREMKSSAKPDFDLLALQFAVPVAALRIADFTTCDPKSIECAVFHLAELCDMHPDFPGYGFSQAVATIVASHFDGMRIPGVRGEKGMHYSNVVLFRGFDTWKQWASGYSPALVNPK